MRTLCWSLLVVLMACGSGGGERQAREHLAALLVPQRSLGVESFNGADSLAAVASALYPEVDALVALGAAAVPPLREVLADVTLDGTDDGDRVRALVALVLERGGAVSAVPDLLDYVRRGLSVDPVPFFSLQAATHAVAVLSGEGATKSLYGRDEVVALTGVRSGALELLTAKGSPIEHQHLIGPAVPPAWWTDDFTPSLAQARDDVFTQKLDGIATFEDPITLVAGSTRSYDCHSWTFREPDTRLADLAARYHILGESVETILADEGWVEVTATPSSWRLGDVVVFYKVEGETPTHTGRLSALGATLTDPALRFTSKWSVTLPVVDVSVRDCTRLYGKVVKVFGKGECVPVTCGDGVCMPWEYGRCPGDCCDAPGAACVSQGEVYAALAPGCTRCWGVYAKGVHATQTPACEPVDWHVPAGASIDEAHGACCNGPPPPPGYEVCGASYPTTACK